MNQNIDIADKYINIYDKKALKNLNADEILIILKNIDYSDKLILYTIFIRVILPIVIIYISCKVLIRLFNVLRKIKEKLYKFIKNLKKAYKE